MTGRIVASDVAEVKRRTDLADVVREHVTLQRGGVDSMKGLCPFHDEKSPSFHVRPNLGYYHCFGCGESGDAIAFVQRIDHLTFTEAVERLAARINYPLRYEDSGGQRDRGPNRARLYAANQAAAAWYAECLAGDEAAAAREFLSRRGFDEAACVRFGVGYAPKGWQSLRTRLRAQGYADQELLQAGLVAEGSSGSYDRFRGRIVWPIRDTSGQTLGFGARKLFPDDQGPKYLNTPETPIYQKSRVLYGLDLAKKTVSAGRAVVVEGYTDVMACHLAGETAAVATCGTAFGHDHVAVLRRVMGDRHAVVPSSKVGGKREVIFTFDPDVAGRQAALRAFGEDQAFWAQTYVAIAPEGLDPADLRLHRGDAAVLQLFDEEKKVPLVQFAMLQVVRGFDLNSVGGQAAALQAAAPMLAELKDPASRHWYERELGKMLGVSDNNLTEVRRAVRAAREQARARRGGVSPRSRRAAAAVSRATATPDPATRAGDAGGAAGAPVVPEQPEVRLAALPRNPQITLERDALMAMLQQPAHIGAELLAQALDAKVHEPALRVVRDALAASLTAFDQPDWLQRVLAAAPQPYRRLVSELAVARLPLVRGADDAAVAAYCRNAVTELLLRDLRGLADELLARVRRIGDASDLESRRLQEQRLGVEMAYRSLRGE